MRYLKTQQIKFSYPFPHFLDNQTVLELNKNLNRVLDSKTSDAVFIKATNLFLVVLLCVSVCFRHLIWVLFKTIIASYLLCGFRIYACKYRNILSYFFADFLSNSIVV
jgi:hypothetical protein